MSSLGFDRAQPDGRALVLEGQDVRARIEVIEGDGLHIRFARDEAPPAPTTLDELPAVLPSQPRQRGAAWSMGPATVQLDPFQLQWRGVQMSLQAPLVAAIAEPRHRRYFGLGERTGQLDKRGRRWINWTTDNWQHNPGADPLYQAHPFVLALERDGAAWGLYLDDSWRTEFDLGASDPHTTLVRSEGPDLNLYLVPGVGPKAVVSRFTKWAGRPPLPPLWALGYHQCRWSYETADEVEGIVARFRALDLPLDAMWLDIDYMADDFKVFTFSPDRFPDPAGLVERLAGEGVRTVVIVDPGVKKETGYETYDSGHEISAFVTAPDGAEVEGHVWPKPAVWPDFSRADVRAWWGDRHRVYIDAGVDGIWNDMNEPSAHKVLGVDEHAGTLPEDTVHGQGTHAQFHNLYGRDMCRATAEGLRSLRPDRRPFVLTRSGFTGIQKHAWVWTGDNTSWWEHLQMSLPMLLNLGVSGVPFCGADVGGFNGDAGAELLARWTWLSVFYPFMRNHSCKGTRHQEPWVFDDEATEAIRKALRLRYQLLPTAYTLAWEATRSGLPLMRPLFLEFPEDADATSIANEFMFGPDLLVAPVLEADSRHRLVYIPKGAWQDFWSGNRVIGEGRVIAESAVDRIPIYQRGGSAIPMTDPALHTTDAWWSPLRWRVVPGPQIHGLVYEDDGDGYGAGKTTELLGVFDGHRLQLELVDVSGKERNVVAEILGLPEPTSATHDYRHTNMRLEVDLSSTEPVVLEW